MTFQESLLESIKVSVLERIGELVGYYHLSDDPVIAHKATLLLHRLAIGDRKYYKALLKENIGQKEGVALYKLLFEANIIEKEYTFEAPLRNSSKQHIKKIWRDYVVEDKVRFVNPFDRFWFTFCAHQTHTPKKIVQDVEKFFEKYVSYTFEVLACEYIQKYFACALPVQSYWDLFVELDLFTVLEDGRMLVGECKWKNQKINTKIFGGLQQKCAKIGLKPDLYLLFSKSGFSNHMLHLQNDTIQLYGTHEIGRLKDV